MGKHDPAFTAPLDMDGAAVALGVSRLLGRFAYVLPVMAMAPHDEWQGHPTLALTDSFCATSVRVCPATVARICRS